MRIHRRPNSLRKLVTASLLGCCLALSSCAHPRGVEKSYEVVTPIPGTGVATADAPVNSEIVLEEESWSTTGILRGHVRRSSEGTQEFDVETRRVYKLVPYEWSDAIILRSLVAPLYFGLLGPLWEEASPDYGGDGSVGLWDRVRYSLAMLNYFEAFPNSSASERREESVGTIRERRPATVEQESVPGEVTLQLTLGKQKEQHTVPLEQGSFAIDVRPMLPRFFGLNLGAILTSSSCETLVLSDFGRKQVADLLLRSGSYAKEPEEIAPEHRKLAKKLIEFRANAADTPKTKAVALFNLLYRFEHGAAPKKDRVAAPTTSARKIVDAAVAAQDGMIQVSARGIDLYRISVTVKNLTNTPMLVRLPAGVLFDCAGSAQDMLTTEGADAYVSAGGSSAALRVSAACANMSKATPVSRDSFQLGAVSDPRLAQVAPHLKGLPRQVRQAIVWIITDNATLSTFRRYRTPRIRRKEVLQAIAVFERAGVSIEDRAIWSWYTDDKSG